MKFSPTTMPFFYLLYQLEEWFVSVFLKLFSTSSTAARLSKLYFFLYLYPLHLVPNQPTNNTQISTIIGKTTRSWQKTLKKSLEYFGAIKVKYRLLHINHWCPCITWFRNSTHKFDLIHRKKHNSWTTALYII